MPTQTTPFREIRFTGGRFDETAGWLDFDAAGELQRYRKLIAAIAGEKWRQEHPGRSRLPANFTDGFGLGITGEIGAGSCALTVSRRWDDSEQLAMDDYFGDAAQLIDETLLALRDDANFPDGLTTAILPMFAKWGESLQPDESIILGRRNGHSPTLNPAIRERLRARMPTNEPYLDDVNLLGEIRAADLDHQAGGTFRIRLDNGDTVPGVFSEAQESTITEALHAHLKIRLRIAGQGRFDASGQLQRVVQVDSHEVIPAGPIPFDETAPSVLDIFDEIRQSIPAEAFSEMPTDLSVNLKHYLYGWPKVNK